MSARTYILTALADALPNEWTIYPDPTPPAVIEPGSPAIIAVSTTIKPGPRFDTRAVETIVWLLDDHTDPAEAETSLDEKLPILLEALDHRRDLEWTEAERGLFNSIHQGYKVTITVITTTT